MRKKTKQMTTMPLLCVFFSLYFLFSFPLMETVWATSKISFERSVDLALISSTFSEDCLLLSPSLSVLSERVVQTHGNAYILKQEMKLDAAVGF